MAVKQRPVNSSCHASKENQFDEDARTKSIHGTQVGIAQFGQGPEGHCRKQNVHHRRCVREPVAQEQPRHTLGLKDQGHCQWQGKQRNEVHAPQGDAPHGFSLVLDAGHPAEQDAVTKLAQHRDGLSHQVDRPIVDACRCRAQPFSHEPNVHFGRGVGEHVEGCASQSVAQQFPPFAHAEAQGPRDVRQVEVPHAQDQVLDQQGTDIRPDSRPAVGQAQAHAEIAEQHAQQGTARQPLEIHLTYQQAA